MLAIDADAQRVVSKTVAIFGAGRNGTSLVGSIVGSTLETHYSFEPPTLYDLFGCAGEIGEAVFKFLTARFIWEQIAIGGVSGRTLNCNQHDLSGVQNMKSDEELHSIFSKSWSKTEAAKKAADCPVSFKLAGMVPALPDILSWWPEWRTLFVAREPSGNIRSLIARGWFSRNLREPYTDGPFLRTSIGNVPTWMSTDSAQRWDSDSPEDRAARYYVAQARILLDSRQTFIVMYEDLLQNPREYTDHMLDALSLSPGSQTPSIIESVRPDKQNLNLSIDLEELGVSKKLANQCIEVWQRTRERAGLVNN